MTHWSPARSANERRREKRGHMLAGTAAHTPRVARFAMDTIDTRLHENVGCYDTDMACSNQSTFHRGSPMYRQPTSRPNEPPMPEPLAYFLTWTTYGTWLPGDERGWVLRGKGFQLPNPIAKQFAEDRMTEPFCTLDSDQRKIVEDTIRQHCQIRKWELHAVNCRSNHVHVVVTADVSPEIVRDQFKAWCTRKLKEHARNCDAMSREKWWTKRGSQRYIGDDESLDAVCIYAKDAQ